MEFYLPLRSVLCYPKTLKIHKLKKNPDNLKFSLEIPKTSCETVY